LVTGSRSDDELLTSGGPEGFFYRRHVDAILRYFARSTRNPEVAADLTAEAFAAALEAKRRFKPGGPPAQAWLYGIASRKLADYHRRGYAEDRARRRLGMERVEPTEEDLRRIEGWRETSMSSRSSTSSRPTSATQLGPGFSTSANTRTSPVTCPSPRRLRASA
jgi:RNA polymerase sigma-70 factor (ECF subfamily)